MYNADRLHTQKTVGGVKSEYIWDGTQLAGQKNGTGTMLFLYEGTGLSGFQKDGVNYYYLRNGQNDIIGILDTSGNRVVSYTYDAWGKLLTTTGSMASTLGAQNPFRYRGYYFDAESGLYYLQSRYYDPNTGRFLNADGQLNPDTGHNGMNLFAYCNNNFINKIDMDGYKADFFDWLGDAIGKLFGVNLGLQEAANGKNSDLYKISSSTILHSNGFLLF